MLKKMRVQKIISNNTSFSRRHAEELIKAGKVKVNDVLVSIGACASEEDEIKINNEKIGFAKKFYVALNKQEGYVTSTKDPHEKTVMKQLPKKYEKTNIKPVGRLDKNTVGLLILTNDGDLANRIMHPSNNIKKVYVGEAKKEITKKDLEKLRKGIVLEEGLATCKVSLNKFNSKMFEITLNTGWTRQIRRMMNAINNEVISLKRIKIGGLDIADLKKENLKEYTKQELEKKIFFE